MNHRTRIHQTIPQLGTMEYDTGKETERKMARGCEGHKHKVKR